MTRTRFGALVAATMIVVSACGSSSASTAPSAAASAAPSAAPSQAASAPASAAPSAAESQAAGGPKDGGTLVAAIPGDISSTDTAFIQDSNSSAVSNQVIEGLVGTKPGTTGDVIGVLATDWTVSPDGLTYKFNLRTGVKFHDGTDFDAAAVCFNYDRWKNFTGALASGDYSYYYAAVFGGYGKDSNMVSCTADSPSAVTIVLQHPYSSFLLSQTITSFGINSPTALKALDADNPDPTKSGYNTGAKGAMVGTGPFKFSEYVANDHITVVRNDDYWNKDAVAHLEQVKFRPYPDAVATLNALQSGDIDFAFNIGPTDLTTVQGDSKLQAIDRGQSCNLFHLAMNQTHKPFDNAKIREAVAYAINKQALIDTFYGGQANLAVTWMPKEGLYAKDENLPAYDPEKAKALIAESGVSADQLAFDFWYPSNVARPYMPDPKGIFTAIAADLEAVGFKPTPQTKPWREGYLKEEATGKYPMWLIGWTCDWAGPDNFLDTAFFNYQGGKPSPEFAYKNDELQSTMKAAEAATTDAEAKTLWEKAQDLIRADMPTVPIVNSTPPAAAAAYVKGFVGSGNLTEILNTVWLDK
ncbi:MAG: ABC transporter substrate-binding protein [Chloroflexota bacterium]